MLLVMYMHCKQGSLFCWSCILLVMHFAGHVCCWSCRRIVNAALCGMQARINLGTNGTNVSAPRPRAGLQWGHMGHVSTGPRPKDTLIGPPRLDLHIKIFASKN